MGVVAEPSGATRSGWETARAAFQGGAMPITYWPLDRCDRCGAAAQVRVEMAAGELLFCQHHARQHGFTDER